MVVEMNICELLMFAVPSNSIGYKNHSSVFEHGQCTLTKSNDPFRIKETCYCQWRKLLKYAEVPEKKYIEVRYSLQKYCSNSF